MSPRPRPPRQMPQPTTRHPDVAADVTPDAAADVAEDAYPPPAPGSAPAQETIIPAYVPPARPLWDHARDIVQGLIQGQGDITIAELRRLDLVRPEKVLEVADEWDGRLQGRGNESKRARLAKIKQHAEMLMPPVADLGVVESEYETSAPGDEEDAVIESGVIESGVIESGAAESGAAEPQFAAFESGAVKEDHGTFESSAFEGVGATREPENADALGSLGRGRRTVGRTRPFAGPAARCRSALRLHAESCDWGGGLHRARATAPAAEPLGEPAAEAAGPEGSAAEAAAVEAAAEWPPDEDVLGLDQSERTAALNSLTPKELGRLFSATDDKSAKLSIIDTLETMPGVETISVIQLILDDPDPEVQLRALDAGGAPAGRGVAAA